MSHKIAVQRTVLAWPARALAIVSAAALLGACSSSAPATKSDSSSPATSTSAGAASSLHEMLPAAIKSSGVLRIASTFGYPPDEYYGANNTPTGISIDLGNAVAGALGLKAEFINVAFDSILVGLLAGRYDTVIGAMSATPERVQQFNMVTYQNAGAALLVSGGNPKHIEGLGNLCGLTVALLKGSHYIPILQGKSQADCVSKGKSPFKLNIYDGSADYFQAVASQRADATYTGFEAAKYAADNSGGKLTFIDKLYPDIPYGAPFTKQNLQLAKAVQVAFTQIINNGTYAKIMAKWGVTSEAISASRLLQAKG